MQNKTHAVMAQRTEDSESLDNFPTPPWATRALLEYILINKINNCNCLEPACGVGHMSKVLKEYFSDVKSSDIAYYGYGEIRDFTEFSENIDEYDWIITNPPFKLAEEFIIKSLKMTKIGVAVLVRTVFIESIGRYNRLFKDNPPSLFVQFSERVPIIKGRLDPKATTATGYCWLVWEKEYTEKTRLVWIPPCRRKLERVGDYSNPI